MTWTAKCGWMEAGKVGINFKTVEVEVLPSIAGPFSHAEVAGGETMQVVSMDRDEEKQTANIGLGGSGSWPPKVGVTYPEK